MIDTHAHLDACDAPAESLVRRAREAGVDRILTVGSGIDSCRASLALAEVHDGVAAVLGLHPHQAAETGPHELAELRRLLAHEAAVAVGETGLDYFRDYAPRDRQAALFREQLLLAAELGKPIVVHTRAADDDTAEILAEAPPGVTIVLHCFSSPGLLPFALERGAYVSFAGNVTFPNAAELRGAARLVPEQRLLAETDSPYLAPQALRGRPNEPANVVYVRDELARVRGEDAAALEAAVVANARRAFGLP